MSPRCPFRRRPAVAVRALIPALLFALAARPGLAESLQRSDSGGVLWTTPVATVSIDRGEGAIGPFLRVGSSGPVVPLDNPVMSRDGEGRMTLTYAVKMPDGNRLEVRRRIETRAHDGGYDLVETFDLRPGSPIRQDVEIIRPFSIGSATPSDPDGPAAGVLPLKSGWARNIPISHESVGAEYRLGHWISGPEVPELALPVVQADLTGRWQAAVCADPRFSALFSLRQAAGQVIGEIRYRYRASKVPIEGVETRSFGFALRNAPPATEPFGRSMDAFFRLMMPDVPPGPRWLHEIYMVGYDYLSDGGEGWGRDVEKLAEWLTPEERKHVVLCFHGWYDYLGVYSYDDAAGRMKDEWVAMPGTRKVRFTRQMVKDRLRRARDLGFRVIWYFADGLIQDSGAPGYRPEWNLLNEKGETARPTWEGPDTLGKTFIRNPANPEVARWYLGYLRALLKDYGPVVDGFTWDETYYVRASDAMDKPVAGYGARGMLDLVKALTKEVEAYDPQKVFMTADSVGFPGVDETVGYAMFADGNFQDSWCHPEAWAPALLPNWRNTSWSCIWADILHFHWMKWGVENFSVPVAISNGFGDDCGPAEWTPRQRDEFLGLFRKRMAAGPAHVRFLTEDPAKLIAERGPDVVASDPIPAPRPGEVNWALASSGSRATASSELREKDKRYPAAGAIDGSRAPDGWGAGHGWAGEATQQPQWLEVEFTQPRQVSRFVITTYHSPKQLPYRLQDSARKLGVLDYTIEAWDERTQQWTPVVREDRDRALVMRVHSLSQPVTIRKFRIIVTRVAMGAAGIARLLQVEAWGTLAHGGE